LGFELVEMSLFSIACKIWVGARYFVPLLRHAGYSNWSLYCAYMSVLFPEDLAQGAVVVQINAVHAVIQADLVEVQLL